MKESQQLLEWREEARQEGRLEGHVEAILQGLTLHLEQEVPGTLAVAIAGITDLDRLRHLNHLAWTSSSIEDFRQRGQI